jgi:hypothetical protein
MSIMVACQCGKRFKAADQHAGKKARCPGCGQALTIPAPPRPVEEADDILSLAEPAQAEVFQPAARTEAPKRPAKTSGIAAAAGIASSRRRDDSAGSSAVPHITFSPMVIIFVVLAILIPSAIYYAKEGPMKANADWKKISDIAEDNIDGQITRAMDYEFQHMGFDMTDIKYRPQAKSMFFDEPIFMFRVPESINFQGNSTEGMFHGVFHPHTWRFEVTVPILKSDHKVTGSASETDQTLEVDGAAVKD